MNAKFVGSKDIIGSMYKKVLAESTIHQKKRKKNQVTAKSLKISNENSGQKSQSFFTHFISLKGFFGEIKSKTLKKK